eukprot:766498-Hanusia_phi.AAC.11
MGGKCLLLQGDGALVEGPACTDNFQVAKFIFEGMDWLSVEQCYQAMKFRSGRKEYIQMLTPFEGESDKAYSLRMWAEGQGSTCFENEIRSDWPDVKVHIMYLVNCAKYKYNAALQEELLATGDQVIVGKPSTWQWQLYNGVIQMEIRRELREGALGEQSKQKLLEKVPAYERMYIERDLIKA